MTPPWPTAIPASSSAKCTAYSLAALAFASLQLAPPSLLATTVPLSPTAQTWSASNTDTPRSVSSVPGFCEIQLAPWLVVLRTTPPSPTAHPVPPT